jgi:hypothetical protein
MNIDASGLESLLAGIGPEKNKDAAPRVPVTAVTPKQPAPKT